MSELCNNCDGTGSIDTAFSGGDPSCPQCDGGGTIHPEEDNKTHQQDLFNHPLKRTKVIAIWEDRNGIAHQAVGAHIIPQNQDTFIMWTACGTYDIPATEAVLGSVNEITCVSCLNGDPE